ncbi:MAG: thioredoxin fold domain-containing protein [Cyanobacteria bacterium TGS_CYA1]|nr:thioredoxin fold domain-containing protein [Cyanobacteria bacterium TGS_CYA1]
MKKTVLTAIAMACLFGLQANSESALSKAKLDSSNKTNTSKLIAEAKTGMPRVLDFYTTWCGPCKRLAPILEELEKQYKDKVTFERYDAEAPANKALVEKYRVEAYPTVIFIDKNGKVQDILKGAPRTKDPIVERIDAMLK